MALQRKSAYEQLKLRRKKTIEKSSKILGADRVHKILHDLERNDLGFGYDPFGLKSDDALRAVMALRHVYNHWFRVQSTGHENVPSEGRCLVIPNHSGVLPLDGVMIGIDLALKMDNPRVMRAIVEHFFGAQPFFGTFLARVGQVIGTRRNLQELLKTENLVALFPEGAKGTGKGWRNRYKLRRFNVGFIEFSLQYQVPIVPTAVIGGEEQFIMLYDIKWLAKKLGWPYAPITLTFPHLGLLGFVPFPSRYHIYYGEPIRFYEDYPPETVNEPKIVRSLADQVQDTVQKMVNDGLRKRKSIFR